MAEKRILPVSDETKEKIRKLSAESLPINPSAKGMKPEEVKKAFYAPIIDGSTSILAELQRIIGEANTVYGHILGMIGDMEGLEETVGYENLADAISDALIWGYDNTVLIDELNASVKKIDEKINKNEELKTKAKSFLEAINENHDKIVANEEYRKRLANALKGKVIGNPVAFNDVDISPLAHDINCYVRTSDGSIANGVDVIVTTGSESTTYTTDENGRVTIPSVTKDTVITSIPDVVIEVEYNVDTNVIPRDYARKTDYASYSDYGLVKINSTYYGLMIHPENGLGIQKASKSDIKGRTSERPIVPENLDYAVKAALSDCKVEWTDEEKNAVKDLLGLLRKEFKTLQNEGETITFPSVVNQYAQISEIHGMDSDYYIGFGDFFNYVRNYPLKLVTDKGVTLFELPADVLTQLTDFGIRGNYIYFDNGKAFYYQENRLGEVDEKPLEGESTVYVLSYIPIIKLAEPKVTDISNYIGTDGIIDIGDAEYLTVVPFETEEEVEAMAPPDGTNGDYHFNFPTVKIIVEA